MWELCQDNLSCLFNSNIFSMMPGQKKPMMNLLCLQLLQCRYQGPIVIIMGNGNMSVIECNWVRLRDYRTRLRLVDYDYATIWKIWLQLRLRSNCNRLQSITITIVIDPKPDDMLWREANDDHTISDILCLPGRRVLWCACRHGTWMPAALPFSRRQVWLAGKG